MQMLLHKLPVKIQRGQTSTHSITLTKVTAPKGSLFVESTPGNATVLLNKARVGLSGSKIESLTPGRYVGAEEVEDDSDPFEAQKAFMHFQQLKDARQGALGQLPKV